jgi:hypothetical protein
LAVGRNMQLSPAQPVTVAGAPAGFALQGGASLTSVFHPPGSAQLSGLFTGSGLNFASAIQARSGMALTSQVPVVFVGDVFPAGSRKGWGLSVTPAAFFSEVVGQRQSGSVVSLPQLPFWSPHCGRFIMEPELSSMNITFDGPTGNLKNCSSPATGLFTVLASEVVTLQHWSSVPAPSLAMGSMPSVAAAMTSPAITFRRRLPCWRMIVS